MNHGGATVSLVGIIRFTNRVIHSFNHWITYKIHKSQYGTLWDDQSIHSWKSSANHITLSLIIAHYFWADLDHNLYSIFAHVRDKKRKIISSKSACKITITSV